MADFNQAVILNAVRHAPEGLSRVELAELTGLSAQSVSNITRRLLDRDLITEAGTLVPAGRGKPRTLLRLHAGGHFAIGVHIDPTVTTVALLDLVGDVVASVRTLPASAASPTRLVGAVTAAAEGLVAATGVDARRVLGLGIAAPGPLDPGAGVVLEPPLLPGWTHVGLRALLHEATGYPVVLHKDAAAAALAELWRGPRGSAFALEDFVFLYLGTGLGAGLVVGGELLSGTTNNAGEIGHLMVAADGPRCNCGQRGCVGAACMPRNLVAEAGDAGLLPRPGTGDREIDDREIDELFTDLCALAADGSAPARRILEASAFRLARGAATVSNLLDVRAVVFGGPIWDRISAVFLPILRDTLLTTTEARQVHPVTALGSSLGADVGAIGAGCLVLEHAFSTRPATLLLGQELEMATLEP
ncbi:transcriptional regulator [Pseudonocardia sp. MH-G8]|nr:transcriptional regulator [Pseudonocardia sp. MH-G8]